MLSLFVCNTEKELLCLKKRCTGDYLIGTTEVNFYQSCINVQERVVFLETEDTMLDYHSDTWDIVNKINSIIKTCNLEWEYLYKISCHIEGGLPYHIEEILSNIKLLEDIIETYGIKRINMIDSPKNWKINEAAFLVAYCKRMDYNILDSHGCKTKDCLYTLERSRYNIRNKECRFCAEKQKDRLNELLAKKDCKKDVPGEEYDIGFIYAAVNSGKHYGWLMGDLSFFQDDFKIGIIVLYESEDLQKIRSQGFHAECVEEYFDKIDFMEKYSTYLRDCETIVTALNNAFHIEYTGIDLTEFLCRKVINCLERESFEYLYMDSCMNRYFADKKYKLIRAWGNSNFWQTRLAYANTRNAGPKFWRIERNEVLDAKLYEPDADIVSIRFFANDEIRNKVELKHFNGNCYYCYDYLLGGQFYKNYNLEKRVKSSLLRILFAPSYPFLGVRTLKNYFHICESILGKLSVAGYKIALKNHPNIDRNLENDIYVKYCNNENIEVINKYENISEEFCKYDFIITDASTVLFDAAVAQKPVFCIVGCQDYELCKQHEEGFFMYRDVTDMCNELVALIGKGKQLEQRLNEMLERQNAYIKKIVGSQPFGNSMSYVHEILKSEMGRNIR